MTTKEWLEKAKSNAPALRSLIGSYHPGAVNRQHYKDLPITAPNVELAIGTIRRKVAKENQNRDPVAEFDRALEAGDIGKLIGVLNGAWFGVPESTSCWGIEGFSQAVGLLEDTPDEPDEDYRVEVEDANI